ncbi:hypothetical protein EYR40_002265 [Pleurotus pulmonarius]|nr:hypothetical protein EYR36_002243 [Pleurotus pulmonarius]KAF4583774.1 hypothetical protein EYR40_002265 [Pleurotus pulmonarius]
MVKTIPSDPAAYRDWLDRMREEYERFLNDPDAAAADDIQVSDSRRCTDLLIEYAYEIDLDDEVFWVNGMPMFRLDCMPTTQMFLAVLNLDDFGHCVTNVNMPTKHAYQIVMPPEPSSEDLASYESLQLLTPPSASPSTPICTDVYELLGVSETPSPPDLVRIRLYEIIVGTMMSEAEYFSSLLAFTATRNTPSSSRPFIIQTARNLVLRAFLPMVFDTEMKLSVESWAQKLEKCDKEGGDGVRTLWLKPDVCFRAGFHLDHNDNLRAAVGGLVRDIHQTSKAKGIVYGIICSLFHCVIVKVDLGASSFRHSSALQFFPSRFTESLSTPGIDALIRLASQYDDTLGEVALSESPYHSDALHHVPTHVDKLPPELIAKITPYIHDLMSLLAFATLNDNTRIQVSRKLSFPFIGNYRLIQVDHAADKAQPSGALYSGRFVALNANGWREQVRVVGFVPDDTSKWYAKNYGEQVFNSVFTRTGGDDVSVVLRTEVITIRSTTH